MRRIGDAGGRDIRGGFNVREFVSLLRKPRTILMLVKAGLPIQQVHSTAKEARGKWLN
jgi:6-phosphogluconate dehydrogenase